MTRREAAEPDRQAAPERGHRRQAHRPAGQTPRGGGRCGDAGGERTDAAVAHRCRRTAAVEGTASRWRVGMSRSRSTTSHKLIVADEVVNDGNDTGQPYAMAQAACTAVGADTLAGGGRYRLFQRRDPEGLRGTVGSRPPCPRTPRRGKRLGRRRAGSASTRSSTMPSADAYRCPAGKLLHAMGGGKLDHERQAAHLLVPAAGWSARDARSGTNASPPKRPGASSSAGNMRTWIERHRQRMANTGEGDDAPPQSAGWNIRSARSKCRAGYRHFLMRGFDKCAAKARPDGAVATTSRGR